MTCRTRIDAARSSHQTVVGTGGLLARFNDAGVLDPMDVHAARAAARLHRETDERAILAAALAVRGTRFGHACVRLALQQEVVVGDGAEADFIESLPWPDPDDWHRAVAASSLTAGTPQDRPLVLVDDRLYLERYFCYEDQLVRLVRDRLVPGPSGTGFDTDPLVIERLLPRMDGGGINAQRIAADKALTGRLTLVVGGPGTGKTYLLGRMLAAIAAGTGSFPRVALCAPTGKAAARLGEEIADSAREACSTEARELLGLLEASTIHRLLGWTWGRNRFAHYEKKLLPHDLVIVDEMSMVSLPMVVKLLSAVRPDAHVVLVGDPYQLESIEVGTVLADIVGPAVDGDPGVDRGSKAPIADRVVVLREGRRYDEHGPIAALAGAIRRGNGDRAMETLATGSRDLGWVEDRSSPDFARLLAEVVGQRCRLVDLAGTPGCEEAALAALTEVAVLCANREGPGSVTRWQRAIEAALDRHYPGLRSRGRWYPGRPVMITRNDYNLDLYNGDIGVVAMTDEGLRVTFHRGGLRSFPPSYLGDHTTVHALTIHKSQGSQFDEVIVSLPPESSRLLTRELLYTAVTRASKKVTVVGPESVIRLGVERSVQRASGLRSRLWRKEDSDEPSQIAGELLEAQRRA